jgi:hypothetical protein
MNVFTRDSQTRSSTDSRISLCFFVGSCMSSRVTPELGLRQIPESAALRSSCHRQLEVPGFCMFATPRLHRITIPELRTFANPRLRRFQASENREFPVPEKHVSRTLSNLNVSRVTVFLNSPTLDPRGSGLTPTIRFHEYFGNLVKNVTLRTSEGTRVARKP